MFGIFKKKARKEKLYEKYKQLMSESHKLSTVDRSKSDATVAEAEEVLKEIEKIPDYCLCIFSLAVIGLTLC